MDCGLLEGHTQTQMFKREYATRRRIRTHMQSAGDKIQEEKENDDTDLQSAEHDGYFSG
jgi:hypothetical protein